MHVAHLRQADLNLLVVFTVLAEERNVSRAAKRLSLSQPAMTRALQRLRHMFSDDLLVRVSANYEPTPKGQQLIQELEEMLPRLDRLLTGAAFDPFREKVRFRLAGTDYAAHVLGSALCRKFLAAGSEVSFDLSPVDDSVFDAMERGRIDLLLYANDGRVPANYSRETIFTDELVCVVARDAYGAQLTLKQYLDAPHVGVATAAGAQTLPEKLLREAGRERRCAFRVPYFAMAVRSVAGTALIATVPRRLAVVETRDQRLKILRAPKVFGGSFGYLMAWHPRMKSDAAHVWLRAIIREAGNQIMLRKSET